MENSGFNYKKTHFLVSAATLSQCPENIEREVAFAGRSNAGKSSALNALTNSGKLARTSKTPGRTRLINFFEVSKGVCLVDLPGYGYAKVSRSVKEEWGRHLNEYLEQRKPLKGIVLLMDIRHPLKPFDISMLEWSSACNMPLHILLTKADKLKYGAAKNMLKKTEETVKKYGDQITIQLFSSAKHTGIDELSMLLDAWLAG